MTEYFEAEFSENVQGYEAEYVEAKMKPESVGRGTPGWEARTIRPEPGCVFSAFEMNGMPEPTAEETATENGRYPVARLGYLRVQVPQPAGEVELTENRDYDVSGYETAKVRVPQGVFPAGELLMDHNGTEDCSGYETVNVAVPIVFDMELLELELLTVTVAENFTGVLNGALAELAALAPEGYLSDGVNINGFVYAALVDTPDTVNQLVTWGSHYHSGIRTTGRRYDGTKVVIQSSPGANSWAVTMKAGTKYKIAWMRFS